MPQATARGVQHFRLEMLLTVAGSSDGAHKGWFILSGLFSCEIKNGKGQYSAYAFRT